MPSFSEESSTKTFSYRQERSETNTERGRFLIAGSGFARISTANPVGIYRKHIYYCSIMDRSSSKLATNLLAASTLFSLADLSTQDAFAQLTIKELTPPRVYPTPSNQTTAVAQPVLPPSPLTSLSPEDQALAMQLGQNLYYFGPSESITEVLDVALAAYFTTARSWFGSIPPVNPTLIEVTLSEGDRSGSLIPHSDYVQIKPVVKIKGPQSEAPNTLTHEMAHLATINALGDAVPRWFNEGLAQQMESKPWRDKYCKRVLVNLYGAGQDIPLRELFPQKSPKEGQDVPFYAKSFATIDYLLTISPGRTLDERRQHVSSFMRSVIKSGLTQIAYDDALKTFFKVNSSDQLDQLVKTWVAKTYAR